MDNFLIAVRIRVFNNSRMEFKIFYFHFFLFYFVNLDISDSVLVARGFFLFKSILCVVRIASGVKNRRLMHSKKGIRICYVEISSMKKLFD